LSWIGCRFNASRHQCENHITFAVDHFDASIIDAIGADAVDDATIIPD
jgi:hypothetical protein